MSYIEIYPHDGWYDCTIEDFCDNVLPHFGLDVSYKDVAFSGFWSQGDGASFEGNFYLSDVAPSDLKSACPTEVELHQLAEELAELTKEHPEIQGKVTRMSSRYSHSNTMIIGEWSSNNGYCNDETEAFAAADAETALLRIFRQLADWLYRRLESEYEYQLAVEASVQWADAIEELKPLLEAQVQLQVCAAANPPPTLAQSNALTVAIAAVESKVESLTSTIDQLSDQFHYWHEGKPMTIEEFYENYF